MMNTSEVFLCLKLADKSFYSLYKREEKGDKKLVLTPAQKGQEKSEIALYKCERGKKQLLREILLENQGDMEIRFSLSREYLSYEVLNERGDKVTEGLIELGTEEFDLYNSESASNKPLLREKKNGTNRLILVLSVLVSLGILLFGGYTLARNLSQDSPPQLQTSGMTPR